METVIFWAARYRRRQARALLTLFRLANGRDAATIEELEVWAQNSDWKKLVPSSVFARAELRAEIRALHKPEASA
jgi:hypothetical protein